MKLKLIIILIAVFILNSGNTAYAYQVLSHNNHNKHIYTAVKNRLSLTDKDLAEARSKGKTVFDLARNKGISEEAFRIYLSGEAAKSIDSVINKGLMPKILGEKIKNKATTKIKIWDGKIEI